MGQTAQDLAIELVTLLRDKGLRLVTAESCTGGLIASLITDVAGASDILEGGFITYSNQQKSQAIGVDPALIQKHGAVSAEVAASMALGALTHADAANIAISVTGVAGPGASEAKPAGTVFIGLAYLTNRAKDNQKVKTYDFLFSGLNRQEMRLKSAMTAMETIVKNHVLYQTAK